MKDTIKYNKKNYLNDEKVNLKKTKDCSQLINNNQKILLYYISMKIIISKENPWIFTHRLSINYLQKSLHKLKTNMKKKIEREEV